MSALFGRIPEFDPVALEWSRFDGTASADLEHLEAARPADIGYRGGPLPLMPAATPRVAVPGAGWIAALKTWLAAMPQDFPPQD